MFPRLANANYEYILALPPSERCKHLGAMVVLPAVMTEYDNGQGAFSASAFVAEIAIPPLPPGVTDTLLTSGVTDTMQVDEHRVPVLQDF